MKITLNGEPRDIRAGALDEALAELGYAGVFATAVNGDFIPVALRADRALAEGDRIEVLAPRQGG